MPASAKDFQARFGDGNMCSHISLLPIKVKFRHCNEVIARVACGEPFKLVCSRQLALQVPLKIGGLTTQPCAAKLISGMSYPMPLPWRCSAVQPKDYFGQGLDKYHCITVSLQLHAQTRRSSYSLARCVLAEKLRLQCGLIEGSRRI